MVLLPLCLTSTWSFQCFLSNVIPFPCTCWSAAGYILCHVFTRTQFFNNLPANSCSDLRDSFPALCRTVTPQRSVSGLLRFSTFTIVLCKINLNNLNVFLFLIILRILKSCKVVGPNLLKPHINFILCICIDNFIKVNINKTIFTYSSRKTGV
jgi:hypothetical protein